MEDDAKSRMEYIYKAFLKDEHALLTRMDVLKAEFPAAADAMAAKLELLTGNYLAAGKQLADVMVGMSQEIDRQAATAAQQAGEAAKLDIRQAAAAAASAAVSQAVGNEVANVVNQISGAAVSLAEQAKKAREEVQQAARTVSWGMGRVLLVVVLGGLTAGAAVKYLPGGSGSGGSGGQQIVFSEGDRKAIENGRNLQHVWNNLTPAEQKHINQLLQEPQK